MKNLVKMTNLDAIREIFPDLKIIGYDITSVIGEGGQGLTLGLEKDGIQYTGKVINKRLSLTPYIEELRDLRRGVDIVQQLNHPSIQGVTEVIDFSDESRFVIVKPYVKGKSLQEILDERRLSLEELTPILDGTLDALEYLHDPRQHLALGEVYHRDIKPGNIIIGDDGKVTLIDLDTAKTSNDGTTRMTAVGTKNYSAIEALVGSYNNTCDLYSLGFVAIEALLGSIPKELADSRINAKSYKLPSIGNKKVAVVLEKMVRKNSEQRFQSATEVRKALGDFLEIIVAKNELTTEDEGRTNKKPLDILRYTFGVITGGYVVGGIAARFSNPEEIVNYCSIGLALGALYYIVQKIKDKFPNYEKRREILNMLEEIKKERRIAEKEPYRNMLSTEREFFDQKEVRPFDESEKGTLIYSSDEFEEKILNRAQQLLIKNNLN